MENNIRTDIMNLCWVDQLQMNQSGV